MITLRICAITVLSSLVAGKQKIGNFYSGFEYHNGVQVPNVRAVLRIPPQAVVGDGDTIWVFDFKDIFSNAKLRAASSSEASDVEDMIEPMMDRLQSRIDRGLPAPPACRPVNSESMHEYYTEMKVKKEIMKVINKFVMSSLTDPDTYLSESNNLGPSLALYFKPPFSMLVVRSGRRQWHYIISPPSSLPCWFYETKFQVKKNGTERLVHIPAKVSADLYYSLLPMVTTFLGYPV